MTSWSGDGRRAALIGRLIRGLTEDNQGEMVEQGIWKGHNGDQSRPYWVWQSVFRDKTHQWVFLDRDPRKKPQRVVHEQSIKWLRRQKRKGNAFPTTPGPSNLPSSEVEDSP